MLDGSLAVSIWVRLNGWAHGGMYDVRLRVGRILFEGKSGNELTSLSGREEWMIFSWGEGVLRDEM